MVELKTVVLSVTGTLVAVLVVFAVVWLMAWFESQHDRDLRDCQQRYGGSRYAEPHDAAYQSGMVAACMRGRGY